MILQYLKQYKALEMQFRMRSDFTIDLANVDLKKFAKNRDFIRNTWPRNFNMKREKRKCSK